MNANRWDLAVVVGLTIIALANWRVVPALGAMYVLGRYVSYRHEY